METSLPFVAAIALFTVIPSARAADTIAVPDYEGVHRAALELLTELVAADTTNPPGNESRAVALIAKRLDDAGITSEITEFAPGRQNLVARLRGTGKETPLLLLAHLDVVGATGQAWTTEPHKVTEKDGYLYGRGVGDDLGMAALSTEVLILLKRSQAPLKRDVILALTGDEESGGDGLRYLLKNKRDSITAGLALNEGGGLELGEDGKMKLISIQTAEKIIQDFELIAHGPTGHSSVPLPGNSIYRLSEALARVGRYQAPPRLLPLTRAYFAARAAVEPPKMAQAMLALSRAKGKLPAAALKVIEADPSLAANLRSTCVATLLTGGTRKNALPAEARANLNCRILPDETLEEIRQRLVTAVADSGIEVKILEQPNANTPPSPTEGPLLDAVRKVVARSWPGLPIIPFLSRWATDSRFLREAGIPAYGLNPLAMTEPDTRRAHGIDERIPAKSLRTGVEFLHRLVLELAARP